MADKENQHFVPQSYFRFFSTDKKSISLLNKKSGATVKIAPIKGQASKSYFYGDATVEEKITALEVCLIAGLKKIRQEKDFSKLSEEEVLNILQAVMFQRSRTLGSRVDGKPQQDYFARIMAEIVVNNANNISDARKEELCELLKYVVADPVPFQGMQMAISVTQADCLLDLDRVVIKNRTKRPFIFCDAPAILINPMQQKVVVRGVLGMVTPGIIVLYPLSPRLAIMFIDKNAYSISGKSKGVLNIKNVRDVDQLNKLQILNATNAIYFDDFSHSSYVVDLWRELKKHIASEPKGQVVEGVLGDGNDEREIVHIYEKQLPVMPTFSFMRYEEADSCSHLFDRRLWSGKRYY